MKTSRRIVLVAYLLVVGCAATTPQLDSRHGHSLASLKAMQTADPAASVRNAGRAVDGIDARAAVNSVDRYHQSFALPPAPMNIINVSGLSAHE